MVNLTNSTEPFLWQRGGKLLPCSAPQLTTELTSPQVHALRAPQMQGHVDHQLPEPGGSRTWAGRAAPLTQPCAAQGSPHTAHSPALCLPKHDTAWGHEPHPKGETWNLTSGRAPNCHTITKSWSALGWKGPPGTSHCTPCLGLGHPAQTWLLQAPGTLPPGLGHSQAPGSHGCSGLWRKHQGDTTAFQEPAQSSGTTLRLN